MKFQQSTIHLNRDISDTYFIVSSFISFNAWPCATPFRPSGKIRIIKYNDPAPIAWPIGQWFTLLHKLVIRRRRRTSRGDEWTPVRTISHVGESGGEEPVQLLFDSGELMSS